MVHYSNADNVSKHYYMGMQRFATNMGVADDVNIDDPIRGGEETLKTSTAPIDEAQTANPLLENLIFVLGEFGKKAGVDYNPEALFTDAAIEDYYPDMLLENTPSTNKTATTPGATTALAQTPPLGGWGAPRLLYYYHPDYLGNVEYITDMDGAPYQYFLYTPWGEALKDQKANATWDSPYRFNGKELDEETGLYYYGARYYNPQVSVWLSVDPLASKYPNSSPFVFTGNNPIVLIDPDGRKIVFAEGTSEEFKKKFEQSVNHLNKHGAAGMMAKLEKSDEVYYIAETTKNGGSFNRKTKTIKWNPNMGVLTNEGVELSPTTILNHEVDHALQFDQDPEQLANDMKTKDSQYGNLEEKRVITGSEQETAQKLGEIEKGEVTRKDHKSGTFYEVKDPTSTQPKYEAEIIEEILK